MKKLGFFAIIAFLGSSQPAAAENEPTGADAGVTTAPEESTVDPAAVEMTEEPVEETEAAEGVAEEAAAVTDATVPAPDAATIAEGTDATAGDSATTADAVSTDVVPEEVAESAPVVTEEILAAPEGVQASADGSMVSATVDTSDADADSKPWGVMLGMSTAVGAGSFVSNDYVREQSDYVGLNYVLSGFYSLPVLGHKLKGSVRAAADVELTTPNSNPARRLNPQDTRLTVSDGELYHEAISDVTLYGAAHWVLPTSYSSLNVQRRWGMARGTLGARRSLGPVDVDYSFSMSKNFHSRVVSSAPRSIARDSDIIIGSRDSADVRIPASNSANTSFDMLNSFSVAWSITEQISLAYSLVVWNSWRYNLEQTETRDEFTSINADTGRARASDMLMPSLEVGYDLNDMVAKVVDIPVKLSAAAGISAAHPAQTADNDGILWPVFFNTFGSNRAANNYGSAYLSLVGVY